MPYGNMQGRARVRARSPSAAAICDSCGFCYNLDALVTQYQWRGTKLADTGSLVCSDCLDVPQQQFRTLILPPDPEPRVNPRPDTNVTPIAIIGGTVPVTPGNLGFSQYVINGSSVFGDYPIPQGEAGAYLTDEFGVWITDEFGNPIAAELTPGMLAGLSPVPKAQVLAAVAILSGVPTPAQIFDRSLTLTIPRMSYPVMGTQPARGWLLLYSPVAAPAQAALAAQATWGTRTNLAIGGGEAWFWSTAQGIGAAYQGALSVVGSSPNLQFWAWESGGDVLWLTDDQGTLITDDLGQAIPLS